MKNESDLYKIALEKYSSASTKEDYEDALKQFEAIKEFLDSKEKIQACLAQLEKFNKDTEAVQEKERKSRIRIFRLFLAAGVFTLLFSVTDVLFLQTYKLHSAEYKSGLELLDKGNYAEAREIFIELGDFKDSVAKVDSVNAAWYEHADQLFKDGNLKDACDEFKAIGDYSDCADRIEEVQNTIQYNNAVECLNNGDYNEAITLFSELGNFSDSAEQFNEAIYRKAQDLLSFSEKIAIDTKQTKTAEAYDLLSEIKDYKPAAEILDCMEWKCLYLSEESSNKHIYIDYDTQGRVHYDEYGYRYIYDNQGRLSSKYSPSRVISLEYDSEGKVIKEKFGEASEYIHEYNSQGLRTSKKCTLQETNTIRLYTYSYDEKGNLIEQTYTCNPNAYNEAGRVVTTYTYGPDGISQEVNDYYDTIDADKPYATNTYTYNYGWVYCPDAKKAS